MLMDLSKALDSSNLEVLIVKSYAYRFSNDALKVIPSDVSDCLQRTKINKSLSSCFEHMKKLEPILFNIYLNEIFYLLE